jgi:hypothetical protein
MEIICRVPAFFQGLFFDQNLSSLIAVGVVGRMRTGREIALPMVSHADLMMTHADDTVNIASVSAGLYRSILFTHRYFFLKHFAAAQCGVLGRAGDALLSAVMVLDRRWRRRRLFRGIAAIAAVVAGAAAGTLVRRGVFLTNVLPGKRKR